jgi:branched-chain amino acid transport system substrate-binding protein
MLKLPEGTNANSGQPPILSKKEIPKGAKVTKSGKIINKKGEVIGVLEGTDAAEKVAKAKERAKKHGGKNAGSGGGGTQPVAAKNGPYKGEIGITQDSIKIGFLYPRSGPYQAIVKNAGPAMQAAFNAVNDGGGIFGRKLEAVFGDDGYNNSSAALSSAKAMQDEVFGVSTATFNAFAATHAYLGETNVPFLYGNADRAAALNLRYGFPLTTFMQTQAEMLPNFMKGRFDAEDKTIGVIYQDTPDLKPSVGSFKAAAEKAGLDVSIYQQVSETPSSCVNEVTKLQSAGAEIVYLAVGPLPAACILRDSNTAGYRPTWTGTSNSWNFNVTNQASGCSTNGVIAMGSWATLETTEGQRYRAAMRKYYPNNADAQDDDLGFIGWLLGRYWIEAMHRAGPKPTRETFVLGMEKMRDWSGGMVAPRSFGSGIGAANRIGGRSVTTTQVRNCKWVTIDRKWRTW